MEQMERELSYRESLDGIGGQLLLLISDPRGLLGAFMPLRSLICKYTGVYSSLETTVTQGCVPSCLLSCLLPHEVAKVRALSTTMASVMSKRPLLQKLNEEMFPLALAKFNENPPLHKDYSPAHHILGQRMLCPFIFSLNFIYF